MNLRLTWAAALFALFLVPASAQTVIDQLLAQRQYDLADSYWSAGQRFIDLGQADRGAQFQARAKSLFPGYVPGQAPAVTAVPVSAPAAAPEPQVPPASQVREQNLQGEKIAKLQFQKLLRAYLTGNAKVLTSVLGSSLMVQGQDTAVAPEAVAAFLEAHPAEAGSPDELFEPGTLEAVSGEGQLVQLRLRAQAGHEELGSLVPFWKAHQVYTFDRQGDTWKLTAIAGED